MTVRDLWILEMGRKDAGHRVIRTFTLTDVTYAKPRTKRIYKA